ncbi:MAG: hypothetical protein ACI93T_000314, partial [Porticoccaceae bacterium]
MRLNYSAIQYSILCTRCRSVNQGWMRGGYVGVLFIQPSVRRQE